MYKVTLPVGNGMVYDIGIVTTDEEGNEVVTPIDGDEFLVIEGEDTTVEIVLSDDVEPEDDFSITVGGQEVVPEIIEETDDEGNTIRKYRITFSTEDETEILIDHVKWIADYDTEMYGTSLSLEGRRPGGLCRTH